MLLGFVFLALFVAGQFVAWRNMVRGRFALGFVQFALLFFLADVLLVLHFVAGDEGPRWRAARAAFVAIACVTIGEYLFHAVRRRRVVFQEAQAHAYAEGMDAFLSRADDEARRLFARVARKDPWDSAAALMLASLTPGPRGIRCLKRARARAEDPSLRDEIEEELRWRQDTKRATLREKAVATVIAEAAPAPKVQSAQPKKPTAKQQSAKERARRKRSAG